MSYKIQTSIQGITPLLQHKYGLEIQESQMQGAGRKSGSEDYRYEYLRTMYVNHEGYLFQPATHIEGALVKAGKLFTIKGRKGKTYGDSIKAYVYVTPDEILHLDSQGNSIVAPDKELLENPTELLSVSVMRVKIQRAAVPRLRLQLATGWNLSFTMEVHDDQLRPEVVQDILAEAGKAVGIGDYRPRYGRFIVTEFEVQEL